MYICKLMSYVPVAASMFPALCIIEPEVNLAAPATVAQDFAPPNTIRWQTMGSPNNCQGEYLNTIGFVGQPGQQCVSLGEGDPTLFVLNYVLGDDRCMLTLYGGEECDEMTVVQRFRESTFGRNVCRPVPGYRSLDVVCLD